MFELCDLEKLRYIHTYTHMCDCRWMVVFIWGRWNVNDVSDVLTEVYTALKNYIQSSHWQLKNIVIKLQKHYNTSTQIYSIKYVSETYAN